MVPRYLVKHHSRYLVKAFLKTKLAFELVNLSKAGYPVWGATADSGSALNDS